MFRSGGAAVAKGGRPKRDSAKASTKHVRINDDLAEKLSWVLQVLGSEWSSAKLLDPHIRGPILRMYDENLPAIKVLMKAQENARKNRVGPSDESGA